MCTLSLFLRPSSPWPLVVASNRDELKARPFEHPRLWSEAPVPFVAGRDSQAGGTWMGINAAGVFVGLTNLWTGSGPEQGRLSRGAIVVDLLGAGTVVEARARLRSYGASDANPFIIAVADTRGRGWMAHTANGLAVTDLPPGAHAIGNLPPGDPKDRKLAIARASFAAAADGEDSPEAWMSRLKAPLSAHRGARQPWTSICVHAVTPRGRYGTVCSTVLVLPESPSSGRLFHARGAPCRAAFRDGSGLLAQMAQ